MSVTDTLNQIENLVVNSKRMLFSNKSLIDDNDLTHLVDELRNELPQELGEAKQVVAERQKILGDANAEAAKIMEQAKEYAAKLTDENEIVRAAQEKSRLIMEQTKAQETEIMEKTMANARQLRDDADTYANQVFDHLLASLQNALQVVQQAKDGLNRPRRAPEPPEQVPSERY